MPLLAVCQQQTDKKLGDPVVLLKGVCYSYSGVPVLNALDLNVRAGVTAIVGANGAGKSTLMSILSTAEAAHSGSVEILGQDVNARGSLSSLRRRIGWLPQGLEAPSGSARDFVTYAAWLKKVPRRDRHKAVDQALGVVGLDPHADKPLRTFSAGMKRRAGIAQAIVASPDLLLLDEPTDSLDPVQRETLCKLVNELSADGTSVIVATHLAEVVEAVADQVVVLRSGVTVAATTVDGAMARAEVARWMVDMISPPGGAKS